MSDPWDAIDPTKLLPLVGVRRMSRQFGFLLRHYWMPATELTFRRQTIQNGNTVTEHIVQCLAKCDADTCWWRETVGESTVFRIYNRSEQTYRTREITDETASPENEREARIQAFVHQPILTPLLPIPLGFQWHVSTAEGDYMDFTLESETTIDDMPIVFVRRKGRFQLDGIGTVEREGITAFALERSTILEVRIRDVLAETGSETLIMTKLVQSRLFE